jgi:hypothetical protein
MLQIVVPDVLTGLIITFLLLIKLKPDGLKQKWPSWCGIRLEVYRKFHSTGFSVHNKVLTLEAHGKTPHVIGSIAVNTNEIFYGNQKSCCECHPITITYSFLYY